MLNQYFDKIFCINLDSRSDRWEEAQKEFIKHSLNVERVSAIQGSKMNLEFPVEIKDMNFVFLHTLCLGNMMVM